MSNNPSQRRHANPLKVKFGIAASSQEASFMNATLTSLDNGQAISIALAPPKTLELSDKNAFRNSLEAMFAEFAAAGWTLEVQVGRDDN